MNLGLMPGYSGGQLRLPVEKVQLAEKLEYEQTLHLMADVARLAVEPDA